MTQFSMPVATPESKMLNGQEEAFRMIAIGGVVFLIVVQRELTLESDGTALNSARTYRMPFGRPATRRSLHDHNCGHIVCPRIP
jgi:hypothetical protein